MSLAPYFSKKLWQGKYPIWQDYDTFRSLGLPDLSSEVTPSKVAVQTVVAKASDEVFAVNQDSTSAFEKLVYGLIMGLLAYTAVVKREPIIELGRKLMDVARSKLEKK
jgi:hypothetical protein